MTPNPDTKQQPAATARTREEWEVICSNLTIEAALVFNRERYCDHVPGQMRQLFTEAFRPHLDLDALSRPVEQADARRSADEFALRGADKMAKAILRLVDSGRLDARSEAADALLDYAGVRCGVWGDEINALRARFSRPAPQRVEQANADEDDVKWLRDRAEELPDASDESRMKEIAARLAAQPPEPAAEQRPFAWAIVSDGLPPLLYNDKIAAEHDLKEYYTGTVEPLYASPSQTAQPAVRDALAELVRLKDGPRDAEYERRKPLAWDAASAVLAQPAADPTSAGQPAADPYPPLDDNAGAALVDHIHDLCSNAGDSSGGANLGGVVGSPSLGVGEAPNVCAVKIAEIKKRASAATPGPWQIIRDPSKLSDLGIREKISDAHPPIETTIHTTWNHGQLGGPAPVVTTECGPYFNPSRTVFISVEDADFIAHARTDIPYLIQLVRSQAEQMQGMRKAHEELLVPWKHLGAGTLARLEDAGFKQIAYALARLRDAALSHPSPQPTGEAR